MSPGWHESASQIASSVEKRIARALPVLRIERLASVIPTRSASSVSVIRRSWSRSSSLTAIAISHRSYEVVAHERAFREHAGQHKREEHCEPAVDRKAGTEMDGMRRTRNGFADRADREAETLQREQRPGDRLQTRCVGGDELRLDMIHHLFYNQHQLLIYRISSNEIFQIEKGQIVPRRERTDSSLPQAPGYTETRCLRCRGRGVVERIARNDKDKWIFP